MILYIYKSTKTSILSNFLSGVIRIRTTAPHDDIMNPLARDLAYYHNFKFYYIYLVVLLYI